MGQRITVVAVPPRIVRSYRFPLARLPLSRTMCFSPPGYGLSPAPDVDGFVGDLTADDHLILSVTSRNLLASRGRLRCRVSALIFEPPAIQGRFYAGMRLLGPLGFHRVFTHQPRLAAAIGNGRLLPHGGAMVHLSGEPQAEAERPPPDKQAMASIVASTAASLPGHRMRHRIVEWARRSNADLGIYGFAYRGVADKAEAHLPYRYSVVIENSRSPGYFTEKLIDSLLCWSLPIYWGDPLITDHFDGRGLLVAQTEEEVIAHLRRAGDEEYRQRLPHLVENRRRAIPLARSMFERAALWLVSEDRGLVAGDGQRMPPCVR